MPGAKVYYSIRMLLSRDALRPRWAKARDRRQQRQQQQQQPQQPPTYYQHHHPTPTTTYRSKIWLKFDEPQGTASLPCFPPPPLPCTPSRPLPTTGEVKPERTRGPPHGKHHHIESKALISRNPFEAALYFAPEISSTRRFKASEGEGEGELIATTAAAAAAAAAGTSSPYYTSI